MAVLANVFSSTMLALACLPGTKTRNVDDVVCLATGISVALIVAETVFAPAQRRSRARTAPGKRATLESPSSVSRQSSCENAGGGAPNDGSYDDVHLQVGQSTWAPSSRAARAMQ
eukprot:2915472-Pyramimonas_sp.AAC.1